MRFKLDNQNYKLLFERNHRQLTIFRHGKQQTVKSKYPFTTVTLYRIVDGHPTVISHATVGCLHTDAYSHAKGRLFALQALTKKLKDNKHSEELRAAIWETYQNRGKQPVIETTAERVKETPAWQRALPAHEPTVAETEKLDERIIH